MTQLKSMDGKSVVAEVDMPPFARMPEIIVWRDRVFKQRFSLGDYREVVSWHVPDAPGE